MLGLAGLMDSAKADSGAVTESKRPHFTPKAKRVVFQGIRS